VPWNHEVHLPKYAFEGTQDLWLTIRSVIITSKGQTAFAYPLLGVVDILTEVNKLRVVDLEVVRAWKESCDRLCSNLAIWVWLPVL